MNVGLIARADDRGLGTMTYAFYRHMAPAKTLVVDLDPQMRRGFPTYPDRYPDATVVPWSGGGLDESLVRDWLEGLDVVYSAETFYDPRVVEWADAAGVATVLHVMPEFYRADVRPSAVWVPTRWRLDHLPDDVRVVPVPTETRDRESRIANRESLLRLVHVAGHRAAGDRNGTTIVLQALRMLQRPVDVEIYCQDPRMPTVRGVPSRVRVRSRIGGVSDRWSQYERADLLVLPRRYGGLCLPVLEAAASGLGLVLSDVEPNGDWPATLIPTHLRGGVVTAAGEIPFANADPRLLARTIDQLADDPAEVARLCCAASSWAAANTWDALRPVYETALEEAR